LSPSHPEFIDAIVVMNEVCRRYGLGIGASIINPLDLGRDFRHRFGAGGVHRTFSEGVLTGDGLFRFQVPLERRWVNNKGPVDLEFIKARAFAFEEKPVPGSDYVVVEPGSIQEITEDLQYGEIDATVSSERAYSSSPLEVSGRTRIPGNRVLVVLHMATPEMDYFHPQAGAYIKEIIDEYHRRGVQFREFYSDEMHIQFDWDFGAHFGSTEIRTRFMTDSFARELSKLDPLYEDFDKALVYHCYGTDACWGGSNHSQHVLGADPASLYRTFKMRKTYFEALQDRVVEITNQARRYSEKLYGFPVFTRAHATWQESPTCDKYHRAGHFQAATAAGASTYDYTPDYVYSSSIREAISACYDYFKWNDYLTGGGNDFCECGLLDRNYYGGAMAASFASLNEYKSSYWGAWGFPDEVRSRFSAVSTAFGLGSGPAQWVHEARPRVVDVAIIYPKDLLYCEERFGSWMVQYGYANYITADKLVEKGQLDEERGVIEVGNCRYSTLVVAFEPLASDSFLRLLKRFIESGGSVVWMSAFPVDATGHVSKYWQDLFGVRPQGTILAGFSADSVCFEGELQPVGRMDILTDFLVDRVYPVDVLDASVVARASAKVVGTIRRAGKGIACYLGCRLRDDQSGSTGEDVSTLSDVLHVLRLQSGSLPGGDDSPEFLARKGPRTGSHYFASFDNGAISAANHYRSIAEAWDGGFFRDKEKDREALKGKDLPGLDLVLDNITIRGQTVSYAGEGAVIWRLEEGQLLAFAGRGTTGICLNGKQIRFSDIPATLAFAPVPRERLPGGYKGGLHFCADVGSVWIPVPIPVSAKCYLDRFGDGQLLEPVSVSAEGDAGGTRVTVKEDLYGRTLVWLW